MLIGSSFFWDVAGPVFPHQVLGLLGYGVPASQLLYGSVSSLMSPAVSCHAHITVGLPVRPVIHIYCRDRERGERYFPHVG